ncbi:MAG: HAD hydrolase-like protein [Spirochaetales bacterium]|nr:HAD hydrolase-like protein [Spirochaetales bacterium]
MDNSTAALKNLRPVKKFFIGIDSDGCAFDTMEIKHKECFCPVFINHFNLQAVSKYAREAWEFVNLYSRTRGINRFLALIRTLELLEERKEVILRNVEIPARTSLMEWVKGETKLGNPALKKAVDDTNDPELTLLYNWSIDVNETVAKIVRNVPPFPFVKESLKKIEENADSIVISQTPVEALDREWNEHGISRFVKMIAGQEMGTKSEHILYAAKGKYDDDKILMIGDAPGDLKAAKDNNALYFPIIPGQEEKSWELFYKEGLDRFFNGSYTGKYEEKLIDNFLRYLPELPTWKQN